MKFIIGSAGLRQNYSSKNDTSEVQIYELIKEANINKIYQFDTSPGYGDIEGFLGTNFQKKLIINSKIMIVGSSISEIIKNCESQIIDIKKQINLYFFKDLFYIKN